MQHPLRDGLLADDLYVALTRPALAFGVPYAAVLATGILTVEAFLISRNLLTLTLALPLYGARQRAKILRAMVVVGEVCRYGSADPTAVGGQNPLATDGPARRVDPAMINRLRLRSRAPTDPKAIAPYSSMLTDRVVMTDNGDLVTTFQIEGASFQTREDDELNDWHERLNLLWRTLADPTLSLWIHLIRQPYAVQPPKEDMTGFAGRLSRRYYDHLQSVGMRSNRWYLTVAYRPTALQVEWTRKLSRREKANAANASADDSLNALSRIVEQLAEGLARYEPRQLSTRTTGGFATSEQLEFYSQILNGHTGRIPLTAGHIGRRLQTARTVFGIDTIEYRAATTRRFGAFLAIKDYPTPTFTGMLNGLLNAAYSFVLTQSFTFLPRTVAHGLIQRQLNRLRSAGDLAQSQLAGLRNAQDDLASNRFAVGDHHLSLQLLTEPASLQTPSTLQVAKLEQAVAQARVT